MKKIILLFFILFSSGVQASDFLDGQSLKPLSLEEITSSVPLGSILILGELHDDQKHHDNQTHILEDLIQRFPEGQIHLGMEFLDFTEQWSIYQFLENQIDQETFLQQVQWAQPETFPFYSHSIDLVKEDGGQVLGLNIPRSLTSKVAKNGPGSLTKRELSFLPQPLALGSDSYFERFYQMVGGDHVPYDKIKNYFWAQSIWDDVMSETALQFMAQNPEDILVIFVGDFHVAYGGGLKEVIERKGFEKVYSLSQVNVRGLEEQEISDYLSPHPQYGPRAHWIGISR